MKNIIIAAAVGISAVSFNAQAADSTQACGMFENETRFNPTSLSDYQECWLDFHYPDKMSGTLGSLFWVKVGDEFVSMPIQTLVREGSKENAKKLVVDTVINEVQQQIIEEQAETIETLEEDIKVINEIRTKLVMDLAAEVTAHEADEATILEISGELGIANVAVERLEEFRDSVNLLLQEFDGHPAFRNADIENLEDLRQAVRTAATDLDTLDNLQRAEDAWRLATSAADIVTFEQRVRDARTAALNLNRGWELLFDITVNRPNGLHDSYDNTVTTDIRAQESFDHLVITDNGVQVHRVGMSNELLTALDDGVAWDQFLAEVGNVYEAGYNAGYDDGYDAGYAHGFRDGVDSVVSN